MQLQQVRCVECKGTGAEQPDCPVCHGNRMIHWRAAAHFGYRKADFDYLDGDYGDCPRCSGSSCDLCNGDGTVSPDVADQGRERVLIYGLTQTVPPLVKRDYWRPALRLDNDVLLSKEAAKDLYAEGLIRWSVSVFGDEIYLTDAGEQAARIAHVRHALRCGVQP